MMPITGFDEGSKVEGDVESDGFPIDWMNRRGSLTSVTVR